MIDLGISKMALIGVVALIVIGPEKLPRVARTVGTLLGKAQRYVSDVKAEVSRSMELDELKKMRESVTEAAKDVENTIQSNASEFEKSWADATRMDDNSQTGESFEMPVSYPAYRHPKKRWRVKQGATPELVQGPQRHADPGLVGRGPCRPFPAAKTRLNLRVLQHAPRGTLSRPALGPHDTMTDSTTKEDELAGTEQPFVQHLVELRDRLDVQPGRSGGVHGLAGDLAVAQRPDRPDCGVRSGPTCRQAPN